MSEYNVGDCVRLKSGGPEMTIWGKDAGSGELLCQWFEESKLHNFIFRPDVLYSIDDRRDRTIPGETR
ncbi:MULTISPECIES: YodC family protein [Sphingomonas]|jgi:uncharacterized protein YodC (DUF2158 family)|uniref:DUF2158 domain-containing protein n=1 Tax=Sphingomonas sanguinis TaxID=33051 RepID=A0A7Y7QXA9_9SPHN|nr:MULTISPECIES: DUF2158 domain-containing protein [Sphingomonas]MBZ6383081.1 DUF2158 domain-containing protein [Sphingomonas sanguinis]NNG48191.1 DUF2158 domain-containing protein [Sphingomonas sanguinis]NNG54937.1 DUF2158 domain-containing protein [Sphingomonas sanguinis]NVP32378.1 DUF2158 domain-containing protein [Sphingomonas sanguinis]